MKFTKFQYKKLIEMLYIFEHGSLLFLDIIIWIWVSKSPTEWCRNTRISSEEHSSEHPVFSEIVSLFSNTSIEICISKELFIHRTSLPIGTVMCLATISIVAIHIEGTPVSSVWILYTYISVVSSEEHTDKQGCKMHNEGYSNNENRISEVS